MFTETKKINLDKQKKRELQMKWDQRRLQGAGPWKIDRNPISKYIC